jgi:hypothetical protein
MKSSSIQGTPYTSIRYRDDCSETVDATPERAVERSLTAPMREQSGMEPAPASTVIRKATVADAEDRIGLEHAVKSNY